MYNALEQLELALKNTQSERNKGEKIAKIEGKRLLRKILILFSEYFIHEVTFRMNEEFHVPWDRSSQIRHFCTLPAYNEIDCTTTAPTKGWNLRTRMIFTSQGLIDEKTNLDKNIATNKTYTRLKDDQNETIDDDENGIFNPDIDHEGSPFPEENEDDEDWGVWE